MSGRMTGTIRVAPGIELEPGDLNFEAVRASGPGGQNVNKVASAIHLRFDLQASRLPERVKQRLLNSGDQRVTAGGVVVIKAERHRTQARNRDDALQRLLVLLRSAAREPKRRVPTKPGRGARERRLKKKGINSKNKQLRKAPKVE